MKSIMEDYVDANVEELVEDVKDIAAALGPEFSEDNFLELTPHDLRFTPEFQDNYKTKLPGEDFVMNDYNFNVKLEQKKNCFFSSELNKAFIRMDLTFTILVNVSNTKLILQETENLNLRVFASFIANEDQHLAVKRCANHKIINEDGGSHVVVCIKKEAKYEGSEDEVSYGKRLSIKIPIEVQGSPAVHPFTFEFKCQNSCASGISRKQVALVFALEATDKVIARKRMPFKCCSCPGRDMKSEENLARMLVNGGPNSSKRKLYAKVPIVKRVKTEARDENTHNGIMQNNSNECTLNVCLPTWQDGLLVLQAVNQIIAASILDNPQIDTSKWETIRQQYKRIVDEATHNNSQPNYN